MQDMRKRDMMGALYRLIEKYEIVPDFRYSEDVAAWWVQAGRDLAAFGAKFADGDLAKNLALAWYQSLEDAYKAKYKGVNLPEKNSENLLTYL